MAPSLQLNRPQSSAPTGQRPRASSSSTAATSPSSLFQEDAPVLSARPGGYWQKKPSLQEATPAAPPKEPPPKLVGRPAKPTPPPAQGEAQKQMPQEEEDQQLSAAAVPPQEPRPTLGGRPAQPTPPPPPQAQVEAQQQTPTEEEQLEEVRPLPGAAPPRDPQHMPALAPAKPSATPAQREKEQQVSQEGYGRQLSAAAVPPQEPSPLLVGRPAKPTPTPAQVPKQVTQQQMPKEQEEFRERSVDSTQESPPDTQRVVETPNVPKQESQSLAKSPARLRSEGAKIGKAREEPAQLSRPQLFLPAEDKQQPRISRLAPPLPALARPAPPSPATAKEAAVDSKAAAGGANTEQRAKPRRLRQVRTSAADKAAAEKAAKPSLQLISPPHRQEKPSVANLASPASWGLMEKLENPQVAELKRRDYLYRQSLIQKAQQEGPQLPPPPLADRPARLPPTVGTSVQKSLTVAGNNFKRSAELRMVAHCQWNDDYCVAFADCNPGQYGKYIYQPTACGDCVCKLHQST